MVNKLRADILKRRIPKGMLAEFERSVKAKTEAPLRRRVELADLREIALSEAVEEWRAKYFDEKEKAERLQLREELHLSNILGLETRIGNLQAQLADMQKQIFGEKSERGASSPAPSPEPSPTAKPRGKKKGSQGFGRKRDSDLPIQPTPHDIDEADKVCRCGSEYDLIDLPPKESFETHLEEFAVVRQHLRRTVIRCCRQCGKQPGIKTASKPAQIIPRSKYSNELWQFFLDEKYGLQRPINRVIQKLSTLGLTALSSTLIGGLKLMHERRIFEVVYEALLDRNRMAAQRHMDETGWKVFEETEGKNSNRWYMWVSLTSDTTIFVLDPRRSNEVISEHLAGISEGIIICDRHSAYKAFSKKTNFIVAFCWIHQRRDLIKLRDTRQEHADWAQEWLWRIEAIRLQNELRLSHLLEQDKFKIHDDLLRVLVTQLKTEIDAEIKAKKLPKERLDELKSIANHWVGLTVFVNNPLVPMDNNAAERALREAVLGRKAYYGSHSIWSGELTSHLFSIYATLEQNGINTRDWMRDYLKICAENNGLPPPDKILQRFLPWNYKKKAAVESEKHLKAELKITVLEEPVAVKV